MNRRIPPLFIGGTGSDAGKSLLVTGLLAIARSKGLRAAPFKAQNMSLNAYVTSQGEEIGVAQAVQARAAGTEPDARMNPVLLKPAGENKCDVIVNGTSRGIKSTREYYDMKTEIFKTCKKAYDSLASEFDVIILEGAGSVAEINLWENDIVNMPMAEYAGARVLLVADIDRGGAFAALYGTFSLFPTGWRKLVAGYVFNKFQGDTSLLKPGIRHLEDRLGHPCLGVIPYVSGVNIPSEDSYHLSWNKKSTTSHPALKIAILHLPQAALLTDFEPFLNEAEVDICFVEPENTLSAFDLLIIPGSKNTLADLNWIKESGLKNQIKEFGGVVMGVCGGMQMMGTRVMDFEGVEQPEPADEEGLGLLDLQTRFDSRKITRRVFTKDPFWNKTVQGFEIHYGKSEPPAIFQGVPHCFGTYLHGIFDSDEFRNAFLGHVYFKKTGKIKEFKGKYDLQESIDRFKITVEKNLHWDSLFHFTINKKQRRKAWQLT